MEEDNYCRICFSNANSFNNPLITPCNCKQYVHRNCIDNWRRKKYMKDQYYRCEVCLEKYKISFFSNLYLSYVIRFLYFQISKFTITYFIFIITLIFSIGYIFSKKLITNNILEKLIIIANNGIIGINILYLSISMIAFLVSYIIDKKTIDWKDSQNFDLKQNYLINFVNLIFINTPLLQSIGIILSFIFPKISNNFLIELLLKNHPELIFEDSEFRNNYVGFICCPENDMIVLQSSYVHSSYLNDI